MLKKKTENQETRLFCHIFIIGGILIGGTRALWYPPTPGYAYNCNFNAICDKILCAFLPFVHVKATLMILFCMTMLNM